VRKCTWDGYKELFSASPNLACAGSNRATGTLGPEQETKAEHDLVHAKG
jgi:hypothetical protein